MVAHTIYSQESMWPEVCQSLLDHLNSDPAGYLHGVAITTGAEVSRQSMQASLMHFFWDTSMPD